MPKDKGADDISISIPWRLDLSVRNQENHDMYKMASQLCGNGITQLILIRHRIWERNWRLTWFPSNVKPMLQWSQWSEGFFVQCRDQRDPIHRSTKYSNTTFKRTMGLQTIKVFAIEASLRPQADERVTPPTRRCRGSECQEMIRHLAHLKFRNPDNLCYILSILRSQLWASLMQDDFDTMCWGHWHGQLIRLLTHEWGDPVQLLSQTMLGDLLSPSFVGRTRQDAAEFAGWLRQHLFGMAEMLFEYNKGSRIQHHCSSRPLKKCMWLNLIDEWFDQPPFTFALTKKHTQTCL